MFDNTAINVSTMHPNTKDEWQFGIRATNGKLVGVVLAHPVCISIGGVLITCTNQFIINHLNYANRRLWYVLIKELIRRVYLCNINHLVLLQQYYSVLKPITTVHVWKYIFANSQLPSSPRTPEDDIRRCS